MSRMIGDALPKLIALLTVIAGQEARAFCPVTNEQPWSADSMPIQVFLNNNIDEALCNPASCPSFDEIRRTVEVVLDEFYDNSGAGLEFIYAGPTDVPTTPVAPYIDGAIHVFGGGCSGDDLGRTAWDADASGRISRARTRICRSNSNGQINWSSFAAPGDGTRSFQSVLSHELMHAVGFDHPDEFCDQDFKSVVKQFYNRDHHHLFSDDINGLQAQYALRRDKVAGTRLSGDGVTWLSPSVTPPVEVRRALSRLDACNEAGGRGIPVAFADDEKRILQFSRRVLADWNWLSDGLNVLGVSPYFASLACKSGTEMLATWLCGTSLVSGDSAVCYATSDDSGLNWGGLEIAASGADRTVNIGVDAAYDPASARYVLIWRNTADEIVSKIIAPGATPQRYERSPGSGQFLRASDAVSIACGSPDNVGSQNCILAWSDTDWFRTLRWAHAAVATSGAARCLQSSGGAPCLEISEVRSMGYFIYGTPSIASSANSIPWELAFHQGGRTIYTLQKRASVTAAWENERSQSFGAKVVNPALGSNRFVPDDVTGIEKSEFHTFVTSVPE